MDWDVFCWTISREMGFVRDEFREVNVPYSTSTSPDDSRTAWIRGHRRVSKCLGVGSDVMAVGFWSVAHQDVRPYFQKLDRRSWVLRRRFLDQPAIRGSQKLRIWLFGIIWYVDAVTHGLYDQSQLC